MTLRGLKHILGAVFCLVMFGGSANALTVPLSEGGSVALTENTEYLFGTQVVGPDSFTHLFFFNPNALLGNTPGEVEANFVVGSGFSGALTLQWLVDAGTVGTDDGELPITSLLLSAAPQTVPLLLTAGTNYFLKVTGAVAEGNKGQYGFTLTTTPIPPALLLFGSALAGLGLLGRRSRRSAPTPLA
jgi:hypothetical protein